KRGTGIATGIACRSEQGGAIACARPILAELQARNGASETGGMKGDRPPCLLEAQTEAGQSGGVFSQFNIRALCLEGDRSAFVMGHTVERFAIGTGYVPKR